MLYIILLILIINFISFFLFVKHGFLKLVILKRLINYHYTTVTLETNISFKFI